MGERLDCLLSSSGSCSKQEGRSGGHAPTVDITSGFSLKEVTNLVHGTIAMH